MTAKVENCYAQKFTKNVPVDTGEKVCLNCIWYEPYYRRNRGNIQMWVPTCSGYCILRDKQRGPLCQPCKDFEKEDNP